MPESSSRSEFRQDAPGQLRGDGEVLPGGGQAREIIAIADDQVAERGTLHKLDPDQVPEGAYKKKLGWQFWLPLGWVLLIVLLAVFAPLLESAGIIKDPSRINRVPPGSRGRIQSLPPFSTLGGDFYPLGTDTLGRDMLSRIIFGAQVSLEVGFGSIFLGLSIGAPIGIVAGYFKNQYRGAVDIGLMSVMYILLAFPPLLLSLLFISFTEQRLGGRQTYIIVFAIGIIAIPPIALLVRAATLSFTQREFVLAARTIGASHLRVIVKEVFPNVILPIVSFAIIGVAIAITAEGALAFLGLSVQPPTPTWGGMINEGRSAFDAGDFWPSLTPCIIMFLTILCLNLTGDRLREYFDVKEGAL
jgi:peptide/nickel transport system permease protein